jgi:hypothetical protein
MSRHNNGGALSHGDQQASEATPSWTRRTLLKAGGAAAAALVLPAAAQGRPFRPRFRLHNHLRRSSYRGLVGEHFRIEGAGRLKLERVEDLNAVQAGSETSFALIFSSPSALTNEVPQLYHRWLGNFHLLVSPGAATAGGQTYTAVVNQLASARKVRGWRPSHQ